MHHQNYSKDELIEKLCSTPYSQEEKKNIFLYKDGRKYQVCLKLKINKKLSPFNFQKKHQRFIYICQIQDSNSIHDEDINNDPNNNNINSIQNSQINDNDNAMVIDMNNDDIENEESKINPIQGNNHNYSNREISSGQLNQRSEGGNVNNRIEGSNHDFPSRE